MMALFKDRGQIFLDTEGHLLRILSFSTGHCRCSPFHFTKHFSPSLAENCLRLDNSFPQQGQSSGLVLLRHKSWKLPIHPSSISIFTAKCKKTVLACPLAKKSTESLKNSTDMSVCAFFQLCLATICYISISQEQRNVMC